MLGQRPSHNVCASLAAVAGLALQSRDPSRRYLPEMASDFAWPQHTPEGFGVDGWDGLLHLHAFEKVMGVE